MLTAMTEDTRKEVVSGILDCFEELLDKLEITIPCADTEEEEERKMDDNSARLYGMEYWSLYEQVEDLLTTELQHSTTKFRIFQPRPLSTEFWALFKSQI